MNYIIFCDTPYQVLSAVSFRLDQISKKNRVDLIIDTLRTPNVDMKSLAKRIDEIGIFTNVYCVSNLQNKYSKYKGLIKVLEWIFPRYMYKLMTKSIVEECEYDIVVVSGPFSCQRGVISANPRCDVYFIEDGLGSYIGRNGIRELSWRGKIVQRLFKYSPMHIYPKKTYLYSPEFYEGDYKDITKKMIFPLNNIEKIDYAFSVNLEIVRQLYRNYRFIYFSQLIDLCDKGVKIEKDIVKLINNYKDEFIIRPHPRGVTSFYENLNVDNSCNQWELCCSEIGEDSVLIANFSTALFVPKLIYNKEPIVIFLYKLFENDFVDSSVNRLKNIYLNKDRVMSVSSISELNKIIEILRKKNDD